jgi:tRNA U34 5-methylaminomethyl-2-thiouridine-forming methyltransferase MnmC
MITKIVKTKNGDHTLFVPEFDEHYHSTNGAIEEAEHVYINGGLKQIESNEIFVLEIGFGTGLNAFLSAMFAANNKIKIHYLGLEKYPLNNETLHALNYPDYFEKDKHLYFSIINAVWDKEQAIHPFFDLTKREIDILNASLPPDAFDVIYYDAFGPDKQPEMWTDNLMQKMYYCLKPGGILSTYTAKGTVKESLRKAGMAIKRLKGAAGKHHMLNAIKPI